MISKEPSQKQSLTYETKKRTFIISQNTFNPKKINVSSCFATKKHSEILMLNEKATDRESVKSGSTKAKSLLMS